ncbi:hypothetical protein [Streptomyces axinellae]|uniref:hypothetical protein n=1 Tax=Streptomyces axinellae TaxID=552788 RepID=UPI0031D0B7CA
MVVANRWRSSEDDLPADFEDNRDVHYAALGQPQDAREFITALQGKLRTSLDRFEQALAEGTTGGVPIVKKHDEPWIRVSPCGKQEEPESPGGDQGGDRAALGHDRPAGHPEVRRVRHRLR